MPTVVVERPKITTFRNRNSADAARRVPAETTPLYDLRVPLDTMAQKPKTNKDRVVIF